MFDHFQLVKGTLIRLQSLCGLIPFLQHLCLKIALCSDMSAHLVPYHIIIMVKSNSERVTEIGGHLRAFFIAEFELQSDSYRDFKN